MSEEGPHLSRPKFDWDPTSMVDARCRILSKEWDGLHQALDMTNGLTSELDQLVTFLRESCKEPPDIAEYVAEVHSQLVDIRETITSRIQWFSDADTYSSDYYQLNGKRPDGGNT